MIYDKNVKRFSQHCELAAKDNTEISFKERESSQLFEKKKKIVWYENGYVDPLKKGNELVSPGLAAKLKGFNPHLIRMVIKGYGALPITQKVLMAGPTNRYRTLLVVFDQRQKKQSLEFEVISEPFGNIDKGSFKSMAVSTHSMVFKEASDFEDSILFNWPALPYLAVAEFEEIDGACELKAICPLEDAL